MTSVRLRCLGAEDGAAHEAAVEVLRRGFLPRESACRAAGVSSSPRAERDLLDLVRVALRDGVSVAAYQGDTMVGVVANKIQVRPADGEQSFFEHFRDEQASDPRSVFVLDFMLSVDAMRDLFAEVAEVGAEPRLLELMFLGVLPEAGGQGVGLQLVRESVQVARGAGVQGVSAIFTSDFSRAIGRRLGFKELEVVEHSQVMFDGQPISDALPAEQQRSALVLLKLK